MITINAKSPIKNFDDFMAAKEPQNFSTGGIGGSAYIETVMLTQALKLPIKMLSGYYGGDDYGAMRRGEVIGTISSRSTWEQFVSTAMRVSLRRSAAPPRTSHNCATCPERRRQAKALLALVESQGNLQRFTAGPPGFRKTGSMRCAPPTKRRWRIPSCRPRPPSSTVRSTRPMAKKSSRQ